MAPAEKSGLPDASLDLITVAQALHWFQFDEFFEEARRVMRPDARIAVWCYGDSKISPEIDPLVDEVNKGILGPYWDERRKYIDEAYRTIPFPFDVVASPKLSLVCEWTAEHYLGYVESWSSLQNYRRQHPEAPDVVQALGKKLAPLWKDVKKVSWPLDLKVGKKKGP